jgi:hypothetical protein
MVGRKTADPRSRECELLNEVVPEGDHPDCRQSPREGTLGNHRQRARTPRTNAKRVNTTPLLRSCVLLCVFCSAGRLMPAPALSVMV